MRIEKAQLTVDTGARAAYVLFGDVAPVVARTVEVTDDVLVDLDKFDVAVGVEILDLDATVPVSDLAATCHLPTGADEALRVLLPYVSTWRQQIASTDSRSVVRAGDSFLAEA